MKQFSIISYILLPSSSLKLPNVSIIIPATILSIITPKVILLTSSKKNRPTPISKATSFTPNNY